MKRSITLIELVLAMACLAFIVLAATSIEVAMTRFYSTTDRTAQLVNEVSFVLEHMEKNLMNAAGFRGAGSYTGTDLTFGTASSTISASVERDSNPYNAYNTTGYQLNGNTIEFSDDGGATWQAISSARIVSFDIEQTDGEVGLDISILARFDPGVPATNQLNPEVTMETKIHLGQHSTN